ncbi:MAG: hypothetical protein P4L59_10875 [Desulfosporosinus sp.]|nr:hypothetical protein [Desulfosporosinus sp.]
MTKDTESIRNAGSKYLLNEAITEDVATRITKSLNVPTAYHMSTSDYVAVPNSDVVANCEEEDHRE